MAQDALMSDKLQKSDSKKPLRAPSLPYLPRDPKNYRPQIGLIACGGITKEHLRAYRAADYSVAALCDVKPDRARKRKTEFYPDAKVYRNYEDLLKRPDIEVVDVAAHPTARAAILEDALSAGKHVLSQKPFVLDLDFGRRLVDLADQKGVRLAVNQNGRWAPHFSYIRQAVAAGLLGEVASIDASLHFDHTWVEGTPFEKIAHLILYDYAIHWFDIVACLMGEKKPTRVYASTAQFPGQPIQPPLMAQALIEYEGAQAALTFNGCVLQGRNDRTYVTGTEGTIVSTGPDMNHQTVTLHTADGPSTPELQGRWFPDGFHGTMAELLCAIEEDREPSNNARDNLESLALCFAAIASAERHEPVVPGTVSAMPA